jgi:hypothetical protein
MGAGIVLVAASAMLPVDAEGPLAPTGPAVRATTTAPADSQVLPLQMYLAALSRDLQQPLLDKPPAPPPAAAPAAPVPVVLTGTAVDPRNPKASFAFFQVPGGQVQTVGIGQSILGVELIGVTDKSATVRWQGQVTTLQVVAEGGQP